MRHPLAIILATLLFACSGPNGSQKPDLAFWFRCTDRATPALEEKLDFFLTSNGFKVVNIGKIQRQRNIDIDDLNMAALDGKGRMVEIHAFRESPGSQVLRLYSPPPTRHDGKLEDALLNFTIKDLGCTTDQVERRENGLEAKELHDWHMRRIEGWLKEARQLTERAPNNSFKPKPLRGSA